MIVKVQRSQPPTPRGFILIYTRRGRFMWQGPIPLEIDLWMGHRQKMFAHAHIDGDQFVFDKEAPWQDW